MMDTNTHADEKEKAARLLVYLPLATRRRLKALTAREGLSMTGLVGGLLEGWMQEQEQEQADAARTGGPDAL